MTIIQCPGCGVVTDDSAKRFCGQCGAPLQGRQLPPADTHQTLASKEANARLAAGKRLRPEDRAVLMSEAEARGEQVSTVDKVGVGLSLVGKLGCSVIVLIFCALVLYSCAASSC